MWELRLTPLVERISLKRLFLFFAAAIVASISFILATPQTTHAADAQWKGDNITYNGKEFQSLGLTGENGSLGFPKNTPVYRHLDENGKAEIIWFKVGEDVAKSTAAQYAVYDFKEPDDYSNPTGKADVSLTTKSESEAAASPSSCVYEGIGWIICPVTDFLATAMDWVFHLLSSFLTVRPLEGGDKNPLFRAWSVMRDIANLAFVIAFLVIIYSQITSVGLSTYNIKRMLPRLIAAAILVNTSFWICAILIDLSNIAGFSLEKLFMSLRNMLTDGTSNNWDLLSFQSVTTAVLSGGAIGAAGLGSLIAVGSLQGVLYMLLPLLVGAIVSLTVALLIMTARQAIIVLLVIIAPLAFVAYLLPNTEKYFDKWKSIFGIMLMLFPIFSFLFGGAQVAGTAIILNADGIIMVLFGMFTQAAALGILPFTLKFGGGFLSKFGALTNNKSKGIIDQTRNFAQNQAALKKSEVLANSNLRRRNGLSRMVQGIDQRRRRREGWQATNDIAANNRWEETQDFHRIDTARREAERSKQIIHSNHDASWNRRTLNNEQGALRREMQMRTAGEQARLQQSRVDTLQEEFKAYSPQMVRDNPHLLPEQLRTANPEMFTLANQARSVSDDAALYSMRKRAAERQQGSNVADRLLTDDASRAIAGGMRGAESAFSDAIKVERDEYENNVKSKLELMKHFNLDATQYQHLALGKGSIQRTDSSGHTFTFTVDDMFTREAAIARQLKAGSYGEIEAVLASAWKRYDANGNVIASGASGDFATSVSAAIKEYKLDSKAGFFGSQTIGDIGQGRIFNDYGLDAAAIRYIEAGKVGNEALSSMAPGALDRMFKLETLSDTQILQHMQSLGKTFATPAKQAEFIGNFRQNMDSLRESSRTILDSDILKRNAERGAITKFEQFLTGPIARDPATEPAAPPTIPGLHTTPSPGPGPGPIPPVP